MAILIRLSALAAVAAAAFLLEAVVVGGASEDGGDGAAETTADCEIDPNTGTCIVEDEGGGAVAWSLSNVMKQIFRTEDEETNEEEGDSIGRTYHPTFESLEGRGQVSTQKDRSINIWELLQWGDHVEKQEEDRAVHADDSTMEQPELDAWEKILMDGAKARARQEGQKGIDEKIKIVATFFEQVRMQFQEAFDGLDLGRFDLLQLYYLLQWEESVKNPSWKRRQHRYMDRVSLDQALALSDALYMNALAYADTCEEIDDGIKAFRNNSWVMLNCTTESTPTKPAHFLAVRRPRGEEEKPKKDGFGIEMSYGMPWGKGKEEESTLEVAFIVRATKDIMDMLTDALLQSVPYRGGLAHDGILQSAKWLHDEYKDFLPELLKASGRDKLKLWTIGYSLGAGAAALLTMEFNEDENDDIVSHSLGFGTPALVTSDLSESAKSTITTVINDADCVSRMSGPHLFNAFLRGVNYNYVQDALQDFDQLVPFLRDNLPLHAGETILSDSVVAKLRSDLATSLEDKFAKHPTVDLPKELQQIDLIPPGECIHIYREPGGWAGNFVPCHRFDEIEIIRGMVDHHLLDTDTGYGPTLLNYIRQLKGGQWNWQYEYDMMDLPHIQKAHAAR